MVASVSFISRAFLALLLALALRIAAYNHSANLSSDQTSQQTLSGSNTVSGSSTVFPIPEALGTILASLIRFMQQFNVRLSNRQLAQFLQVVPLQALS
jgi:hypothetical protein